MLFETLIFAFSFLFVGAVFFGYPLGVIVGRRRERRDFEGGSADVLDAEIVEYKREVKR